MLNELLKLDAEAARFSFHYDLDFELVFSIFDMIRKHHLDADIILQCLLLLARIMREGEVARRYHPSELTEQGELKTTYPVKYITFLIIDIADQAVFFDHETSELIVRPALVFLEEYENSP